MNAVDLVHLVGILENFNKKLRVINVPPKDIYLIILCAQGKQKYIPNKFYNLSC